MKFNRILLKKNLKSIIKKNEYIYKIIRRLWIFYSNLNLKYFSGTNKDIFTDIYRKNKWGDKYSLSGSGSNLEQTQIVLKTLQKVIKEYQIVSLLDLPCGDFYWMKELDFANLQYIGGDIVSDLIFINQKKFSRKNIKFMTLDLILNDLPYSDLLFCRDCLVHFSFNDIFKALKNIKRTKFRYIMTTNFLDRSVNIDVPTGSWRTINLCKSPFNFPAPIESIYENCTEAENKFSDKVLSIWEVKNIPDYD